MLVTCFLIQNIVKVVQLPSHLVQALINPAAVLHRNHMKVVKFTFKNNKATRHTKLFLLKLESNIPFLCPSPSMAQQRKLLDISNYYSLYSTLFKTFLTLLP